MAHALRTSVQDFIEGLKTFEREWITEDKVLHYMQEVQLSPEAVQPYVYFHKDQYTRNLIYRDDKFEVMTICWLPGQKTVIHTHNGSLGWMSMIQGEVDVHNYKYVRCNHPEFQNVIGIDCLAGATELELDRLQTLHFVPGGDIATVDKIQTIHQIENADSAKAGCVSLHVYAPPIDSCVAFDLKQQRCFRRGLRYYSRFGVVEVE